MEDIIREKYKIEYELRNVPGYTAYRAVDIGDREKKTYILNVYSDGNVKRFVKTFHDLKNCPEYRETFVDGGKLAAVFDYKTGEDIDLIFTKKADLPIEYRLKSVDQLLNIGLIAESFPADIKFRIIEHDNFQVKKSSEKIEVNFMIDPDIYNKDYVDILTGEIRKMLKKSFTEPIIEREFFLLLKRKPVKDGIELYSRWKKLLPDLRKVYNKQNSMPIIEWAFSIVIQNIKWFFMRRSVGRDKK